MDNNKLQQSLLNAKRFMSHDKLQVSSQETRTQERVRQPQNTATSLKEFKAPQATYNIPEGVVGKTPPPSNTPIPSAPLDLKPHSKLNPEAINKSNLPPEIKKLMLENPIQDPIAAGGAANLSNDFIEKVSQKMNSENFSVDNMRATSNSSLKSTESFSSPTLNESPQDSPIPPITENFSTGLNYDSLKKVIKECVKEVITENDLLVEKSNIKENLQLRVGNKIFIGNIKSVKTVKKK